MPSFRFKLRCMDIYSSSRRSVPSFLLPPHAVGAASREFLGFDCWLPRGGDGGGPVRNFFRTVCFTWLSHNSEDEVLSRHKFLIVPLHATEHTAVCGGRTTPTLHITFRGRGSEQNTTSWTIMSMNSSSSSKTFRWQRRETKGEGLLKTHGIINFGSDASETSKRRGKDVRGPAS
jgi:hypothetical protein